MPISSTLIHPFTSPRHSTTVLFYDVNARAGRDSSLNPASLQPLPVSATVNVTGVSTSIVETPASTVAIDRQALNDGLFDGLGEPTDTPVPPSVSFYPDLERMMTTCWTMERRLFQVQ